MVKVKKRNVAETSTSSSKGSDDSINEPIKIVKSIVVERSGTEDITQLPCLEVRIYHQGKTHEPQNPTDEVSYKFKSPGSTLSFTLDEEKMNELSVSDDDNEETCYEDQDKTVSVKKSLIDNYRLKSNYYGPLRIISEKVKIKDKGAMKEAIQAKLQHVEIQATDNDGLPVNEHELKILMSQTPGIIPACDPDGEDRKDDRFITLNIRDDEKYKVLKKAMASFQKLADVRPPFNTKIQKIYTSTEGTVAPVTLVTLYPRVDKVVYKTVPMGEKKQSIKKIISRKDKNKPKLANYYRQSYMNWAHRGNTCFSEIRKIGIDFVEEILIDRPYVKDTLKLLGCSSSTSSQHLEPFEPNENEMEECSTVVGSKDFVDDVWNYLTNLVRSDSFLIEFEFEMDEEKWLEIKRAFNMFQVNGEVIPDIVLKVVSKKKDSIYELSYFLRCVGRLIKSGPILSKGDVNDMLKCLAKDKYICVGFSKENFFQQSDQNEMIQKHLKENSFLAMLPFESLHSKTCKAIVRDSDSIENTKMQRGSVEVYGPSVICQPCSSLWTKLRELVDPTLNICAPQELSQKFVRQRYGPLHAINISDNIKSLFTQTPSEFVSGTKRKLLNSAREEKEDNVIKQLKCIEEKSFLFQDDKPSIKVSENAFEKMISIKRHSKTSNTLRKECEACGFQAKSMLALFVHMNDHLGPLVEECSDCNIKLSSKEALWNHGKICIHSRKNLKCSECHNIFPSSEKLFEHMNSHRQEKPFKCSFCDLAIQTMNEYKKHLMRSHDIKTVKQLNFVCTVCNSYFYSSDYLLIHKINQNHCEKEYFKCKICSFSCNAISAFVSHLLTHSYEERESANLATCLECKKVFFSSFKLEDHMSKKHESVAEEKPPELLASEREPPVPENYSCSKCPKVYGTYMALQMHTEAMHSNKETTFPSCAVVVVTCNVCGRKFNSEYFLSTHMKLHTANKPVFQCEECGYVYGKRTQVLEHIRHDHAEQVEKHQQRQQLQEDTEIITDTPVYNNLYQESGQVITIESQGQMIHQPTQPETWTNQLKMPAVEQPQEVSYTFPTFNSQFF